MDIATLSVLVVAGCAAVALVVDLAAALPRLAARLPRPHHSRVVRLVVLTSTAVAALGRAPAGAATPPPMLRIERPTEPAAAPPLAAAGSTAFQTVETARHQVRPGDTLWGIAARQLRARDDAAPPGAAVERYWRSIYSANRAVIGADPDLIFPGQVLVLPVPEA